MAEAVGFCAVLVTLYQITWLLYGDGVVPHMLTPNWWQEHCFLSGGGIVCGWVPVPAKEHNRQFVILKWHSLESNHWVKLNCTLKARTVLTFRHGADNTAEWRVILEVDCCSFCIAQQDYWPSVRFHRVLFVLTEWYWKSSIPSLVFL